MQSISECFEEHHKRWNKVGQLCGISMCSPVSKSPPGSRDIDPKILHQHMTAHMGGYTQHSSFRSMSELVHPSLYQHHHFSSQTQMNPLTRRTHTLPRGKSLTLLQSVPSGTPLSEKKKNLQAIPQVEDVCIDRVMTDSIGSTSSSCASVSGMAAGVSRQARVGEDGDQTDWLQRSLGSAEGGRGSREGSVGERGGLERIMEQKKTATVTRGAVGGTAVKARSSPRHLRNHGKQNSLSSNV